MILAILTAIAATRMSGFAGDADRTATATTVRELQKAIDCYHGEHGTHPSAAMLQPQLTQYTDLLGQVDDARSEQFRFGPYLKSTPPIHPGPQAGIALLWKASAADAQWVYDEAAGEVRRK